MLELRDVSTRYGPITMLRSVSLAVARGQIACLLGPNGAGKTTLIRTILGIVKPVAGSIWFEGQRIDALRTHQIVARGIAVVPEGRRVFPRMTVEENLRMGAFVEWTARDLAARRDHVFSLFPRLGERRRQKAATMSGGEQAMLAMGRALMSRPKLLLRPAGSRPCSCRCAGGRARRPPGWVCFVAPRRHLDPKRTHA
ncbi:MAG: hypothetical protein DMD83_15985 [Candidatus Rokuibacteriota bacterium]|nr:MAG: hypothetical protein DMD83_15985 [Candidatus Rokubacteria bacterium]